MSSNRPLKLTNVRSLSLTGVLLSALVGLAGCAGGVAPGTAVQVGETRISVAKVNATTDAVCSSLSKQLTDQGTVVPLSSMRQYVVGMLTATQQARLLAKEYDVRPGADYQADLLQWEEPASKLPAGVRQDFLEVMSAKALVNSIVTEVGKVSLARDGVSAPTEDQVIQRGTDLYTSWSDQHGVKLDPRFGLKVTDGQLQAADTQVGVAVSDIAKGALKTADADQQAYAAQLPASQRCGG